MTAPTKSANDASMNLWSVAAMGVGAMVGAGIFALLGQVALIAGAASPVAFILGGVVALLSGYSFAKLGVRFPDAGGLSTFFDRGFGNGTLSGTLSLIYLLTLAVCVALLAKAFGTYAAALVALQASSLWIDVFASGITVFLLFLNVAGAGLVGKAEILLVVAKLLILATLMVAGGIGIAHRAPIVHFHPSFLAVVGSVGLTFLAYAGFGMMTNAATSVARPQTTIPRAIYLAIATVIMLYVGLALVVLGSVTPTALTQHPNTAVAEAATPVLGHVGYVIVSVGALLATASGINAYLFGSLNISKSMAEAGQLPQMFSKMLWHRGSPGYLFGAGAVLVAINTLNINALADIAGATFLIVYLAVHVAHWRLIRETDGSPLLVAVGLITMGSALAGFLWSTAVARPWSTVIIGIFIAGSWIIEMLVAKRGACLEVALKAQRSRGA